MDRPRMNAATSPSRLLGLLLAIAVVALAAGCNGLEPPTNDDPMIRALASPAVPGATVAPDPADGWLTSANLRPYQVPTEPWEVVLRYPPEVEAWVQERAAARRGRRDAGTTVCYLNFNGGQIYYSNYQSDATTNTSWIPGKNVTIPAFNASHWSSNRDVLINTLLGNLQQLYNGYNIQFVTTRPSSGDYMMTMIGGSAALIGMEYGVLGVSPLDCSPGENLNLNPVDINFICSEDLAAFNMSIWDIAYTMAHEIAHTFGLAHINRTGDIMYWAETGQGSLDWGAASTRSGESNCSTNNYQDDKLYLTKAIGGGAVAETIPPTVYITAPPNNSTQQSGFQVTITATDASGVKKVELYANNALQNSSTTSPAQFNLLLQPGVYQLVAKATDYYNNVGTSSTVTVTISGVQPTGCQNDTQCGTNQKCQNGTCVDNPPQPTGGALGANCSRNEDCTSTWCILGEQNYCTQACNEAQGIYCPAGYYCSADGFCLSSTPIPPGATGAPCSQNTQCRSGICVDGANNGYCTAVCQQNGTPCPNGSQCVDSGDGQTFICNRPATNNNDDDGGGDAKGGCAAAPGTSDLGLAGIAFLLLLGAPRRRR